MGEFADLELNREFEEHLDEIFKIDELDEFEDDICDDCLDDCDY